MGFASAYLEERALFPQIINEAPDNNTGIIVVVPAYNEPGIVRLLDSLLECQAPRCGVEVIIVINAPADATSEIKANNLIAFNSIQSWKNKNNNCFFRLFAFSTDGHSISRWGVGLARKTGMDEAVRRFNSIGSPGGVILNVDADCTVEKNYLQAVCNELLLKKDRIACSVYFEHPLTVSEYNEAILRRITLYELHLRYYYQGLAYAGFPYVFHTVGSAMAVKALAYVKAGGMNRKQAGEDFYFIQKLVPSGYFSLNTTTVYPSPRSSDRVPFGTGASIGKMTTENSNILLTYNSLAFSDLKLFFSIISELFECSNEAVRESLKAFPRSLQLFLAEEDWAEKIVEIKSNTSGFLSFRKRFFDWFNMFKIVKYLNFVHAEYFEKTAVEIAAAEMLELRKDSFKSNDPLELLLYYRRLEKNI